MKNIVFILCTLNRIDEVINTIKSIEISLSNATRINGVIYVIDQNHDNRLSEKLQLIKTKNNLQLIYYQVGFKGLSRSRNFALKKIKHCPDYICFPDDDCVYADNVLQEVEMFFENYKCDFVTVQTMDIDNGSSLFKESKFISKIEKMNIKSCSFTLFFKYHCFSDEILFDEYLGVGSGTKYGASEEEDLIIRLIEKKFQGLTLPGVYIYHPAKEYKFSLHLLIRAYKYSGGKAYCLLKNRKILGIRVFITEIIKPAIKIFKFILNPGKFFVSISYALGFYSSIFSIIVKN
jgi:hypothetical protein